MKICDLNDREFKITTLKKQDARKHRQFNDLRNKINEQNQYFNKETETLKKKKKTNRNSGDEEFSKRDQE